MDTPERNGEKLDRIDATMTEVRVSMATLSGDVRAVLGRLDGHDATSADVERRLRALERRSSAIPSLAALLAVAAFVLALWQAVQR